jgi:hypothetical protein
MKEFLTIWVIFQFLVIGLASTEKQLLINEGLYCDRVEELSFERYNESTIVLVAMLFPLVALAPDDINYCK